MTTKKSIYSERDRKHWTEIMLGDKGMLESSLEFHSIDQNNVFICGATLEEAVQFSQSEDRYIDEAQKNAFCTKRITVKEALEFKNEFQVEAFKSGKLTTTQALWFNDPYKLDSLKSIPEELFDQLNALELVAGELANYYIQTAEI